MYGLYRWSVCCCIIVYREVGLVEVVCCVLLCGAVVLGCVDWYGVVLCGVLWGGVVLWG